MTVELSREEKIAKARQLKAQGLTSTQIGNQLGVSDSTVRNWCCGGDCERCGTPITGSRAEKSRVCLVCHNGRTVERDQQLADLWNRDVSTEEIARRLGLTESGVLTIVNSLRTRGLSVKRRTLPHTNSAERWEELARLICRGRSNAEIAEAWGTSPESVSQMASYARKRGFPMPRRSEVSP